MTDMQMYEVKHLKRNLDAKILNLIKEFEHKTGLEVAGIYIERGDISEMGGDRKSMLMSVEVQAILGLVVEPQPEGGGE